MIQPAIDFIRNYEDAKLPYRATFKSSGYDLHTYGKHTLPAGKVVLIPTGLKIDYIAPGFDIQLRMRSSWALKGVILPNAPALIDNDYRGDLGVMLLNLSGSDIEVESYTRIAQMVLVPIQATRIFDTTSGARVDVQHGMDDRTGGFGSTGK